MRAAILALVLVALARTAGADATGVFDFQLVPDAGRYVLRDEAYSVTFPIKPQVSPMDSDGPDGTKVHSLTALAGTADVFYGMSITPITRDTTYNAQKGLDLSRDGMLTAIHAKMTSSAPVKLAGRTGRRVLATGQIDGRTSYLDMRQVWDPDHRAIVIVMTIHTSASPSSAEAAFFDSLAFTASGRGPLDPGALAADVPTPAGVLDLQVVHRGSSYVLFDDAMEIAFPFQPSLKEVNDTPPLKGFESNNYLDEADGFSVFGVMVPESVQYDPDQGLGAARDFILKRIDKVRSSETKGKVGGLAGRRVRASGTYNGLPVHLDAGFAWDAKHRLALGVVAVTRAKDTTAAGRAFLDSLVFKPAK